MVGRSTRPVFQLQLVQSFNHLFLIPNIYSRSIVSSRPSADTKYPRAQKFCPAQFRFRPPCTRPFGSRSWFRCALSPARLNALAVSRSACARDRASGVLRLCGSLFAAPIAGTPLPNLSSLARLASLSQALQDEHCMIVSQQQVDKLHARHYTLEKWVYSPHDEYHSCNDHGA